MAETPPNLFAFELDPGDETVGADPHAVKLALSDADRARFDRLPGGQSEETTIVTDLATGSRWEVRRWPCDLNCYCAAAASLVTPESRFVRGAATLHNMVDLYGNYDLTNDADVEALAVDVVTDVLHYVAEKQNADPSMIALTAMFHWGSESLRGLAGASEDGAREDAGDEGEAS